MEDNVTKNEYILYAIRQRHIGDLQWGYSLFSLRSRESYKDDYMTIVDGVVYVVVDGSLVKLAGVPETGAVFSLTDKVTLPKGTLNCVTEDTPTELNMVILNFLLIEFPFGGTIKFKSKEEFNIGALVDEVGNLLNLDKITLKQYKKFNKACRLTEGLSRLFTVSSTPKLIMPPKGLLDFKKKVLNEYITKYGEDWYKQIVHRASFEKTLKDYLAKWMEDDPSNGIMFSGNVKNNAMVKLYLYVGGADAFEDDEYITESLLEGYPRDPDKLAAMFNTIRAASYSRGAATRATGADAKNTARATSTIKILHDDCGVTYGADVVITKDNVEYIVGRYIIRDKKYTKIETPEQAKKYIGRTIELRSPMYCKPGDDNLCKVCVGDNMARYPNGIGLKAAGITALNTTAALKVMHNSQMQVIEVDMSDMII